MLRLNNKWFWENKFLMVSKYALKEQNPVTASYREFSLGMLSDAACVVVVSINALRNAESALLHYWLLTSNY